MFFVSSHLVWNALEVGKQKNKSFLIQGQVGFRGSCGLGDSLKFISRMTTGAVISAAAELLLSQVPSLFFRASALLQCRVQQFNSLAQHPRWLVVSEGYTWPHHFLWGIRQPWVVTLFLRSPLLLRCLENMMFAQLHVEWAQVSWSTEKKPVFKKKLFFC